MSNLNEVDWEAIASRLPAVEDTRVQSGKLSLRDYYILKAGTASKRRQLAPDVASLVTTQIRRWEQSWFENIAFEAKQRGITFEEMFIQFATGSASEPQQGTEE